MPAVTLMFCSLPRHNSAAWGLASPRCEFVGESYKSLPSEKSGAFLRQAIAFSFLCTNGLTKAPTLYFMRDCLEPLGY